MKVYGLKLAVLEVGSESTDSRILEEHFGFCNRPEEDGESVRELYLTLETRVTFNTPQEDGKLLYKCQGFTCDKKNQLGLGASGFPPKMDIGTQETFAQDAGLNFEVDLVVSERSKYNDAKEEGRLHKFRMSPSKVWSKCARKTRWKTKICRNGQKKVFSRIGSHVLDTVEARNFLTRSIMWRSTDFLGHVVGCEPEGGGAITFTRV